MARTTSALEILEGVTGKSASLRAGIAKARGNLEIAQVIYDARTKTGLSQNELGALIGSKRLVIARLESADYEGHLLTMVRRIAAALGGEVGIAVYRGEKEISCLPREAFPGWLGVY